MLFDFLKEYVGQNAAPFVAIALVVRVGGVSLWLTPRVAKWIDAHKSENKSFYDGMMEQPPERADVE